MSSSSHWTSTNDEIRICELPPYLGIHSSFIGCPYGTLGWISRESHAVFHELTIKMCPQSTSCYFFFNRDVKVRFYQLLRFVRSWCKINPLQWCVSISKPMSAFIGLNCHYVLSLFHHRVLHQQQKSKLCNKRVVQWFSQPSDRSYRNWFFFH